MSRSQSRFDSYLFIVQAVRILVTGSHGFISRAVGRIAKAAGHTLLGLGRAAAPPPGWGGDYRQSSHSVSEIETIVREFDPAAVFHGAGSASVNLSFDEPLKDFSASVLVWLNLL